MTTLPTPAQLVEHIRADLLNDTAQAALIAMETLMTDQLWPLDDVFGLLYAATHPDEYGTRPARHWLGAAALSMTYDHRRLIGADLLTSGAARALSDLNAATLTLMAAQIREGNTEDDRIGYGLAVIELAILGHLPTTQA